MGIFVDLAIYRFIPCARAPLDRMAGVVVRGRKKLKLPFISSGNSSDLNDKA
jgi:hypothetical protein